MATIEIHSQKTIVRSEDIWGQIINQIVYAGTQMIAGNAGAGVQCAMVGTPYDPFELGNRGSKNPIKPQEITGPQLNPTQGGTAPRKMSDEIISSIGSPINKRDKPNEQQLNYQVTPREWNWDLHLNLLDGSTYQEMAERAIYHKASIRGTYLLENDNVLKIETVATAPSFGKWLIEMPAAFTWSNLSKEVWKHHLPNDQLDSLERVTSPPFGKAYGFDLPDYPAGIILTNLNDYAVGLYASPGSGIAALKAWGDTSEGTNTKKIEASSGVFVGREHRATAYLVFGAFPEVLHAARAVL